MNRCPVSVTVTASPSRGARNEGRSFSSPARRRADALFAVVLATASVAGFTIGVNPAGAAVFTVTTTADGGAGSLREAVQTLAVNGSGDEVVLQAGATYTLTCAQGGALTHGNTPLTITGNGATITMEASCEEHILDNGSGALVLNGVRVAGLNLNVAEINGAVLETDSTLDLQSVTVENITVASSGAVFAGLFDASGFTNAAGTTINAVSISTTGTTSVLGGVTNNNGASFTDSTITNLSVTTDGGSIFGGIFNNGGGALVRTSVSGLNLATGGEGSVFGGIFNNDGGTITDSAVSDLTISTAAGDIFGGIFNNDGGTLLRSAIDAVTVQSAGGGDIFGGIFNNGGATMTDSSVTNLTATTTGEAEIFGGVSNTDTELVRSTIAGIAADAGGDLFGGIINAETASLVNSTIAGSSAQADDDLFGGMFSVSSLDLVYVTLSGITSDNEPTIPDLELTTFGTVFGPGVTCDAGVTTTSNGYNFASTTTCDLLNATDKQGDTLNPLLGALVDNGGPGPTLLPLTGSPLIDAIPAAACQSGGATGITTDERGLPRPSATSPNCDIGAVEVQPVAIVITPTFTG